MATINEAILKYFGGNGNLNDTLAGLTGTAVSAETNDLTGRSAFSGISRLETPVMSNSGLPVNISSQLLKWRYALGKAKTGGGFAKIACVGDSLTQGSNSNSDPFINSKIYAYPTLLSKELTARGITAQAQSFFGDNGRGSIASTNAMDPRITPGTGWILDGNTTIGQNPYSQAASGTAFTFTPTQSVDTFNVYYLNITGGGVISAQVDSETATTANTGTEGAMKKLTLTTTLGAHTCNVSWSSGGKVVLVGIDSYNSTADLIHVLNIGAAGSTAAGYAAWGSGQWWNSLISVNVLAPDLLIIAFGVNEWMQNLTPASYSAALQLWINTAKLNGDALLVVEPPSAISSATIAIQQGIMAALCATANANGVPVIDFASRWISNAISTAFYGNGTVHPNGVGYSDMASVLAEAIACV